MTSPSVVSPHRNSSLALTVRHETEPPHVQRSVKQRVFCDTRRVAGGAQRGHPRSPGHSARRLRSPHLAVPVVASHSRVVSSTLAADTNDVSRQTPPCPRTGQHLKGAVEIFS